MATWWKELSNDLDALQDRVGKFFHDGASCCGGGSHPHIDIQTPAYYALKEQHGDLSTDYPPWTTCHLEGIDNDDDADCVAEQLWAMEQGLGLVPDFLIRHYSDKYLDYADGRQD